MAAQDAPRPACSSYWQEQGGPPAGDNSQMVECHGCRILTPRPVCTQRYGVGLSTDRAALTLASSHPHMLQVRRRLIAGGATSVIVVIVMFCPECDVTDPDAVASPLTQLDYRYMPANLEHLK